MILNILLILFLISLLPIVWFFFTRMNKTEGDLQHEKENLELALTSANAGVWSRDLTSNMYTFDAQSLRLLGLSQKYSEIRSDEFLKILPPDDRKNLLDAHRISIASHSDYDVIFRVIHPNNSIYSIRSHGKVHYDIYNNPTHMIGIITDVTAQKRIEEAFRQKKESLELALLSANAGVWSRDLASNMYTFDPQSLRLLGLNSDSSNIKLDDFLKILPPEDRIFLLTAHKNSIANHADYDVIFRVKHPDGSFYSIRSHGKVHFDIHNNPTHMTGILTDVTAQKNIEEQLHQKEENLELALTSANAGVWSRDLVTDTYTIDDQCRRLLGINSDSPGTKLEEFLKVIHPDDHEQLITAQKNAIANHTEYEFIYRVIHSNNTIRSLMTHGKVHYDSQNNPTLMTGILTDVTEQKNIEEKLRIEQQNAEAANRAKSVFLAAMSHEIRTPLNGVIGMASLLSDTSLTSEQREYLKTIQTSSEALLNIIDDILNFSKLESGGFELDTVDFDLKKTIEGAVDIMRPLASKKNLMINTQISPNIPSWVNGDAVRLSQILINLLSNAIKFTQTGKITTTISLLKNNLKFEVTDTGIGITPDIKTKLFQSFSQGDVSSTRKYSGSGLGLAIAKRLVESMKGEIGVESTPNQGSTFWFTLPLAPAAPGRRIVENIKVSSTVTPQNAKILIVDDNEVNQQILQIMLKKMEITHINLANNGIEALKALENNSYDLIFMDCEMPEMDGYEATRQIRQHHAKHIPIIAATAHALIGEKEKCLNAGMDDYISKPIVSNELVRVLSQWINTKPGRDEARLAPAPNQSAILDQTRLADIFGDDAKALNTFLKKAIKSITDLLNKLKKQIKAKDEIQGKSLAHNLKGVSGNMGAMQVHEIAKSLEQAILAKNWSEAEKIFESEQAAFAEVVKIIQKELR